MSKKNKKLKKQLRHNLIKQGANPVASSSDQAQAETLSKIEKIEKEPEKIEEVESVEEAGKEIKKILLTVIILIAIIIGVYLLSTKTNFILTAGEWLTKMLNIKVGTN